MSDSEVKKNLLIVIDVTEKEDIFLDFESNVKEINGNGTILIKNPSEKSRLWNLSCDLKETVNTSIPSREIRLDTLDPSKEHQTDYTISNIKQPLLSLSETFDTFSEIPDRQNNAFVFGQDNPCNFKIQLSNPNVLPILNVKLVKYLPDILRNFEIKPPVEGNASIKEEEGMSDLIWEINSLAPGKTVELSVDCLGTVQSVDKQSLGKIEVTYLVNDKFLTLMNPEIIGITDSMSGVTRDEGSQPGVWDCNVEFINESEFQVKLNSMRVEHRILTGKEVVVSETPEKTLNRDQSWDYDFVIESKEVPQLDPTIEFTTLFAVIKRVEGKITKDPIYYEVLRAEIEKVIDPPEVGAYANTDIGISLIIPNKGSAPIDALKISDEIQQDLEPPELHNVNITVKSVADVKQINSKDQIRNITLIPNDKDLTKSHKLVITLADMAKFFTLNNILEIKYQLIARNPKPDVKYQIPITAKLNTKIEGSTYEIAPPEMPELKIKYIQRKFKTLKSIKPGAAPGEFIIKVRLDNKGDVELENIVLKDKIPANFELTSFSPKELEYQKIKGDTDTELVVRIAEIAASTNVSIEYACTGTGEYPRFEPNVVVEGRKDEAAPESQAGTAPSPVVDGTDIVKLESLDHKVKSEIVEQFLMIEKEVRPDMKAGAIGEMLKKASDEISQICNVGPFLREVNQLAKKFSDLGEKIIVGELHDEIISRLREWNVKLS